MNSSIRRLSGLLLGFKESGILLGVVFLVAVLSLATDTFLSTYNLLIVVRQVSFIGIVAIGQTMVLLTGGIDLSVGSTAGLSAILSTMLMTKAGLDPFLSSALGVCFGLTMGLINGVLIAKVKVNPFIATLASGEILAGAILVITEGYPVLNLPKSFNFLGQGALCGLPMPFVILLVIAFFAVFCLGRTPFGRSIYAIGGNRVAARLAGIRVERTTMLVFAISGALAAVSGILFASRMSTGQPTIGASWVMPCITASIIGGTSLSGGEGTILGTLLGAVFMGVLANGIVLLNISSYWERVIVGIVVILAVVIDVVRNKRR